MLACTQLFNTTNKTETVIWANSHQLSLKRQHVLLMYDIDVLIFSHADAHTDK